MHEFVPQYTRQIVEAVQNSPKYDRTVLLISYDETGGLAGTPNTFIHSGNLTDSIICRPRRSVPFSRRHAWRVDHCASSPLAHGVIELISANKNPFTGNMTFAGE